MNRRKRAFVEGLGAIARPNVGRLAKKSGTICAIRPNLYNAAGMVETNQIIEGDCIEVLSRP
jgi:hypothetical protein